MFLIEKDWYYEEKHPKQIDSKEFIIYLCFKTSRK